MASRRTDSSKAANTGTPGPRPENGFGVGAPTHTGNRRGASWHRGSGQGRGGPGPYRGNQYGPGRGRGGGNGVAGGNGNPQQGVKRSREESDDTLIGNAVKRANVAGAATSVVLAPDQVQVERDIFGCVKSIKPLDPNGPSNFSTPSVISRGATDVVMNPRQTAGYNTFLDVTRGYVEQGADEFVVTVKPVFNRPRQVENEDAPMDLSKAREACSSNGHVTKNCPIPTTVQPVFNRPRRVEDEDTPMDLSKARVIEDDSEPCEACSANGHETKNCPIPTTVQPVFNRPRHVEDEDTPIDLSKARAIMYSESCEACSSDGHVTRNCPIPTTVKPVFNRPRFAGGYNTPLDLKNARIIKEVDDDDSLFCEACWSLSHDTKNCPVPSHYGDTVMDPFCNSAIKSNTKGDSGRHPLDGHKVSEPGSPDVYLYCPTMVRYGREEAAKNLRSLFDTFVVGRLRRPPIRVVNENYCFIKIALDISDKWYQGGMPPEMNGAWPYTKQDALKFMSNLKDFEKHGWQGMPKGRLEELHWATIRGEYEAGRIPKQILAPVNRRPVEGPSGSGPATDGDTKMKGVPEVVTTEAAVASLDEIRQNLAAGAPSNTANTDYAGPDESMIDAITNF